MSSRSLVPQQQRNELVAFQAINDFQSDIAEITGAPYSGRARSVLYLLTALVVSVFVLASVVRLDRVVTATGKLVSRTPTILVQPLDTSIVRKILVHPAQEVRKGDLIATLDPTFSEADVAQLRDRVATAGAEVERLAAEAEDRDYAVPAEGATPQQTLQASVFRYRQAELKSRLANFDQKLQTLEAQQASAKRDAAHYRSRLNVTSEIEDMRSTLEKKEIGSRLNTLLATDARTEISRTLSAAEQQARAAGHELEALKAERDAYVQQWRSSVSTDLVAKQSELQQVQEELSKADRRKDLVELRAVDDGTVLSVADVSMGSVVKSGDVLVSLIPANAPLEVEAELDGADQGFVKIGDRVDIKLDAYRFIEHGTAKGIVRSISEDSFDRHENGSIANRRFYKARIEVTDTTLRDVPKDFRLIPGMPLKADIVVGDRTIIMYFMETGLRRSAEAFREP